MILFLNHSQCLLLKKYLSTTTSDEIMLKFRLGYAFTNSSLYLSKLRLFKVKLLILCIIFP